jgi:3',5'-cyclic AMP phosphodiesterase CpdA
MKKIIHLSDIHVGYKDFDQRFQMIINALIRKMGSAAGDCVIVITGDVVDDANDPESYGKVKKGLDSLARAGFEHILVVPGNHDYGTGDMADRKFVKDFQQVFYGREITFPKKDIIDGVAFIGLDSMAAELHWYDRIWAEGELGVAQLKRLAVMLEEEDVRACRKRVIYLHHHPFRWRPVHQLKDAGKLKRVLTSAMDKQISIDALLFGHNHQGNSHNGKWNIARCYDAGTATLKPRPDWVKWWPWFRIQSSVRVIDIGTDDVSQDQVLPFFRLFENVN